MRILLVEDDENKRAQITSFLEKKHTGVSVLEARSLMSGVRQARKHRPELVLLDMTLPNYDLQGGETGGGMHAFGGVELLRQLSRFSIGTKVVVVTQFETFGQGAELKDLPQLDRELRSAFGDLYLGAVYYHASLDAWTTTLSEMISLALATREEER